jgi:hypothetical protein
MNWSGKWRTKQLEGLNCEAPGSVHHRYGRVRLRGRTRWQEAGYEIFFDEKNRTCRLRYNLELRIRQSILRNNNHTRMYT